jgi:RNA polymerase sigma-70 factor (ECF subfamily)
MRTSEGRLPVADLYAEHRRFLWSLCYRMLGSAADAEDVVQDTFIRALERPPERLDAPVRPWLVRVALNLARDLLRRRRRREYVGPWLPSPIDTGSESAPPSHEPAVDGTRTLEGRYDLLESVSFAFLLALEALTPAQRAVLLLRDVFDYSVRETADALDLSEPNVKTIHHRARHAMQQYERRRLIPTSDVQDAARQALNEFIRRLQDHDVAGVEALLAEDVRTTTDGGGEFRSALRTIVGREKVARFYLAVAQTGSNVSARLQYLNAMPSMVVDIQSPPDRVAPRSTLTVTLNSAGKISEIYVVSATRKLTAINSPW